MAKKIAFRNLFFAAGIINVIGAFIPLVCKSFLPPVAPLFYGRPSGPEQLIVTLGLTIAPLFSLGITIINLFLNIWIKDQFIKKVLAVSALGISILTIITVVKIVLLIGFF
jgi:hypothetical protein